MKDNFIEGITFSVFKEKFEAKTQLNNPKNDNSN